MRPSKLKSERLAKNMREHGLFIHLCTPPKEPISDDLRRQIEEKVVQGVTQCATGATVLPKPKARIKRAIAPVVRFAGKLI
jgi:hypothetical protein